MSDDDDFPQERVVDAKTPIADGLSAALGAGRSLEQVATIADIRQHKVQLGQAPLDPADHRLDRLRVHAPARVQVDGLDRARR